MRGRLLYSIASAAALCVPSAAHADEQVTLVPSSNWTLDYGEAHCRLARTFGEGDRKTMFFLEQRQPSSEAVWVAAGGSLGDFRFDREVQVQFGPGIDSWGVEGQEIQFSDYGQGIMVKGYEPSTLTVTIDQRSKEDLEAEGVNRNREPGMPALDTTDGAGIEWLSISQKGQGPIVIPLGNMEAPFAAMNECVRNLVAYWGIDPDQQSRIVSGPDWKNVMEIARRIQMRYPSEALRRGEQATLHFRVMVGADGKATKCEISEVTAADNFGEEPCEIIMKYAEFEPARDAGGISIPSFYASKIRYVLP